VQLERERKVGGVGRAGRGRPGVADGGGLGRGGAGGQLEALAGVDEALGLFVIPDVVVVEEVDQLVDGDACGRGDVGERGVADGGGDGAAAAAAGGDSVSWV
jgi:hypothetical protein